MPMVCVILMRELSAKVYEISIPISFLAYLKKKSGRIHPVKNEVNEVNV